MPAAVTLSTGSAEPRPPGAFRRLWRVLKQLFLEVTGAIFAVLALAWLNAAFRAWTRDVAHWLVALPIVVAAIFAFFSVTSFRRAKKI
jgi:ABC-type Fe3+ transport system permease subunit